MEIKANSKLSIKDFDKLTITKNLDNTYNIVIEKDLTDIPELVRTITMPKVNRLHIPNVRFKDYEIIAEALSSNERHSSIPTTLTVINKTIENKE